MNKIIRKLPRDAASDTRKPARRRAGTRIGPADETGFAGEKGGCIGAACTGAAHAAGEEEQWGCRGVRALARGGGGRASVVR